jgi:MFS family permease
MTHNTKDISPSIQSVQRSNMIIRLSVTAFFFMPGLCFASWASRIPDIKTQLQLTDAQLGTILFALPVGLMCSLPLAGWLVTRWGSRRVVINAMILYALILVMIAHATSGWQLAAALLLFGVFGNLVNIAVNTQAVAVEERYGKSIMASFHGAWSLAGFVGALLGMFFVSRNLAPSFHFFIVIILVAVILLVSAFHILPGQKSKTGPLFAVPDKPLFILGIIGFLGMACEGAMFDWSGVYFQKIVAAPSAYVTLGYTAFMGTMTTGRFVGDYLVNKISRKRMLQLSGGCIAAGLALAIVFPMLITATLGFLLVGFGVSSVIPLVYSAAGRSSHLSPGVALAAVSSISFFGFLIGPPLIGWIAEASSLRYSFALIALLGSGILFLSSKIKFPGEA